MTENIIESNVTRPAAEGSYAFVNGLNIYYEFHGARSTGRPLVLLHGGLGGIDMFAQLLPSLSQTRQVIGVELQAHAHTADIDRPMSFEAMADDIAALIKHLGFANADILGYSLGGGVAWQTAIRHPDAVGKLVVISAPCKRDGWYPESLAGMAAVSADLARTWVGSPMHQAYARVAPKPEDWPILAEKLGRLLRQDYDWSKDVAVLKAPVLIIVGDADAVRTAHAVELFGLLGGGNVEAGLDGSGLTNSRLAILPATTHYDMLFSPTLGSIVTPFLDAPMPVAR
jgi:pimeloyl-ACP methyl ester carboxylesterase